MATSTRPGGPAFPRCRPDADLRPRPAARPDRRRSTPRGPGSGRAAPGVTTPPVSTKTWRTVSYAKPCPWRAGNASATEPLPRLARPSPGVCRTASTMSLPPTSTSRSEARVVRRRRRSPARRAPSRLGQPPCVAVPDPGVRDARRPARVDHLVPAVEHDLVEQPGRTRTSPASASAAVLPAATCVQARAIPGPGVALHLSAAVRRRTGRMTPAVASNAIAAAEIEDLDRRRLVDVCQAVPSHSSGVAIRLAAGLPAVHDEHVAGRCRSATAAKLRPTGPAGSATTSDQAGPSHDQSSSGRGSRASSGTPFTSSTSPVRSSNTRACQAPRCGPDSAVGVGSRVRRSGPPAPNRRTRPGHHPHTRPGRARERARRPELTTIGG